METSYQTEVETLRVDIAGILDEIAWVADAPLPKDDVKQRLSSAAKSLAEKYHLNLLQLAGPTAGDRELTELLTLNERVRIRSEGVGVEPISINMSGLLFAVFGDDLIKRMAKQIDGLDYVAGPPANERSSYLTRLRNNLREAELREEKIICEAEAAGIYISRRADASPEIVLSYDPTGKINEIRLPGRRAAGVFVPPAS